LALVWFAARPGGLPFRLGRLPGDIAYQGKHGSDAPETAAFELADFFAGYKLPCDFSDLQCPL
jgi:hypothetical protein